MKRRPVFALFAALVFLFSSCGSTGGREPGQSVTIDLPPADGGTTAPAETGSAGTDGGTPTIDMPDGGTSGAQTKTEAEKLLEGMTLEEKVGQLFMVRPESLDPALSSAQAGDAEKYGDTAFSSSMEEAMKRRPVGGVVLFGKNISDGAQLAALIEGLQRASAVPLLVGVDEEGGSVARIANSPGFDVEKFKSAREIGRSGDPERAKSMGETIGAYLKRYGFNLDFAPVADVNTNPDNPVIGPRAFGSEPGLVAGMVAAEIEGLHASGVAACAKHFPGHGDTKGDTHKGFVSIDKTWEELTACELIPFEHAIAASVDMVMVSHITAPGVTSDGLPSSLSYEMITQNLRGKLGFDGVVITDAMEMGAITGKYSPADGAVKAVSAGADLVLMPADFDGAYDGLLKAVREGKITEERIDESVLRILALKEKHGLLAK